MWKNEVTKVCIVPVVIGALGMVFEKYKQISRDNWVRLIRKTSERMFVGNS